MLPSDLDSLTTIQRLVVEQTFVLSQELESAAIRPPMGRSSTAVRSFVTLATAGIFFNDPTTATDRRIKKIKFPSKGRPACAKKARTRRGFCRRRATARWNCSCNSSRSRHTTLRNSTFFRWFHPPSSHGLRSGGHSPATARHAPRPRSRPDTPSPPLVGGSASRPGSPAAGPRPPSAGGPGIRSHAGR